MDRSLADFKLGDISCWKRKFNVLIQQMPHQLITMKSTERRKQHRGDFHNIFCTFCMQYDSKKSGGTQPDSDPTVSQDLEITKSTSAPMNPHV